MGTGRKQLLEALKSVQNGDSPLLDGFKNIGHVWDVFPKYKEGGYFYRSWVFEKRQGEEVIRIVLHDDGNQWCSFVCEATEEAMDKQVELWIRQKEGKNEQI